MPTDNQDQDQEHSSEHGRAVHVTAYYTQTARDVSFTAHLGQTVQEVINKAYQDLTESPRPGDQYFTHVSPRIDLAPYLGSTLQALKDQGIGVHEDHGKLVFALDIDAQTGGAA